VEPNTDQALIRDFAAKLTGPSQGNGGKGGH